MAARGDRLEHAVRRSAAVRLGALDVRLERRTWGAHARSACNLHGWNDAVRRPPLPLLRRLDRGDPDHRHPGAAKMSEALPPPQVIESTGPKLGAQAPAAGDFVFTAGAGAAI